MRRDASRPDTETAGALEAPVLAIEAAFDRLARTRPQHALVVDPQRTVTVEETAALAASLGECLQALRLPDGAPVALVAPNGHGFLAALIALLRARLPALLLDPTSPPCEQQRVGPALGAGAILRQSSPFATTAEAFELERLPGQPCRLAGIAVVKMTSGSTGVPRGVAVTAAALCADALALFATMEIGHDERALAAIPLSFSYGLSSLALPALLSGLTLVVPAHDDPLDPLLAAHRGQATFFPTVPVYVRALAKLGEGRRLPDSLRRVVAAGAPLTPEVAASFRRRFGRPVHVFYGASECGGICYDRDGSAAERGTVGTPVRGVEVDLVAGGRVRVRSPAVARSYLPVPSDALAGGIFTSSDLGSWQDGELVLSGRLGNVVDVGGRKLDPREVESLIATVPGVDEVVVGVRPLRERGVQVCWAVVACREGAVDRNEILRICHANLAPHKVPRLLTLVAEIPRNSRGKVDLDALAAAAESPRTV